MLEVLPHPAAADVPNFGQTPMPYERLPQYIDTLGPRLFGALVDHHRIDGIRVINTVVDPFLTPAGAKDLYDDLLIEGVESDDQALDWFLSETSYEPVYQAKEKITEPTLEGYSKRYVCAAVQSAPTEVGAQIGISDLVITTGPSRFSPTAPEGLEIAVVATGPNGEEVVTFEKVELASFFYWDAEPALEALLDMGRFDDIERVLASYASYCERFGGNILNWNNTSVERSQPPMFFRMVEKAAEYMGEAMLVKFLKPMVQHFNFWRDGIELRDEAGETVQAGMLGIEPGSSYRRTARLPDGEAALHNFDDQHDHARPDNPLARCRPRQEMYAQDLHDLATYEASTGQALSAEDRCDFFLGIFAAAETGLDFTEDQMELVFDEAGEPHGTGKFITHHLINPALNAMYAEGAQIIARAWRAAAKDDPSLAQHAEAQATLYENESIRIRDVLQKYCYNRQDRMFGMYDFVKGARNIDAGRRPARSLNGIFVLSSGMTDHGTAIEVLDGIDNNFLRPGGLLAASRYFESDRQWDGKASWPILVRECIKAAMRYQRFDLAEKWLAIHIDSNETLFAREGHLGEKNDSSQRGVAIAIGEYGPQDITMTYAVHLWMLKTLPLVRQQRVAQALPVIPQPSLPGDVVPVPAV